MDERWSWYRQMVRIRRFEERCVELYSATKIRGLIGSEEAVVMIHGGVKREERRKVQELFRNDPTGPAARYGLAISAYLHGEDSLALPTIDGLIKEQPNNPYLYQMKGEILLTAGKAGQAVAALTKAVQLDPYKTGLIRTSLGHAMLETRDPKLVDKAIVEIKSGLSRDPSDASGHGLLARAYAASGDEDRARAAAAEEAYYAFRFDDAKRLARMAQPKLKNGSPEWLRMQDIIDYKPPKK